MGLEDVPLPESGTLVLAVLFFHNNPLSISIQFGADTPDTLPMYMRAKITNSRTKHTIAQVLAPLSAFLAPVIPLFSDSNETIVR